jgi:6-phosphogluconate dehydrogenase
MTNEKGKLCDIGVIGLGVMGRNLLLNMADHGFSVVGFDKAPDKVESLRQDSKKPTVHAAATLETFLKQINRPRSILLLVPAGAVVDSVIDELLPYLQHDDLVIDAGNSHFIDTNIREQRLKEKGILFLGTGISGGEKGARLGPSIMPGGSRKAYERVRPIFEAIAAQVDGEPCVAYMGSGSAGHYVKMVHNGIEYGLMQLIAETYDLLKRGLGLDNNQLCETYSSWNNSELSSYLLEITSQIFSRVDEDTGDTLIDKIRSVAAQTGTGKWTSQSAMELQVPVPTIDIAVAMRDLSVLAQQREQLSAVYPGPIIQMKVNRALFSKQLQGALYLGMIGVYAQGMALLAVASEKYSYDLELGSIARIWRGGCIIRARLLEGICNAFRLQPKLPNLLMDVRLSQKIIHHQEDLRQMLSQAVRTGISTPGLMMSLSYLDAFRSVWQPANLIQAQRDYFGSHRYERVDIKGSFHTEWEKE